MEDELAAAAAASAVPRLRRRSVPRRDVVVREEKSQKRELVVEVSGVGTCFRHFRWGEGLVVIFPFACVVDNNFFFFF